MICEHRLYEFKTKIVRQRRCPEKVRPLTVYEKAKVIKNLLCASAKLGMVQIRYKPTLNASRAAVRIATGPPVVTTSPIVGRFPAFPANLSVSLQRRV